MKLYAWSQEKNEWLKINRGISFDEVVEAIEAKNVLDKYPHPNKRKYPNQYMFVVQINDYGYFVPYVEDDEKYFLKTVIPSRKATKKYLSKRKERI